MPPDDTNWRAVPNFNYEYMNIIDCVCAVVEEFRTRQGLVFVILFDHLRVRWAFLPWSQYRHLDRDDWRTSATMVFRGTYVQLRDIAFAFPPDLFGARSTSPPGTSADDINLEINNATDDALGSCT